MNIRVAGSGRYRAGMASNPPPRAPAERRRDTRARLERDVDLWIATADPHGAPYLIPLSFDWDGEAIFLATPTASRTARNLAVSPTARLALGHTRDVVLVDGRAELLPLDARAPADADAFASRAGFDPRDADAEYVWIRVAPTRIQAWREVEELAARDLLRDGAWLD